MSVIFTILPDAEATGTSRPDRVIAATPADPGGREELRQPKSRLRVLVVEDNVLNGMLLGEMLELMGHQVCAIEATEAEAVAAAARCRPQMMIVDVRLGAGCGFAAVAEILRAGPVPHVFISGEVQARRPGMVILRKPFLEPDLVLAMHQALGNPAAHHDR